MNNYHIYEEIGKGKYSTVYKVTFRILEWPFKGEEKEVDWICGGQKPRKISPQKSFERAENFP